ncbi:MAG: iron-containing redox enzyme family protein [Caldimonas sp.]
MTPFFIDLVTQTDEARRAFESHPRILEIVADGLPVDRYRKFLLELYHLVWHFNPACAAAASRMDDKHRDVRYFLYDHMTEEKGHEEWVVSDLEFVGVGREKVLQHQPSVFMLALNGYNYWSADRRHPCSILGMVYALEVIASVYGGPIAAAIKESLLLEDDRGISFISSHVTMDAEHMIDLRVILNTIQDDSARAAIVESTVVNFDLFMHVLVAV